MSLLPLRSRILSALAGLLAALAAIAVILGFNPILPYYLGFTVVGWAIGLPIVLATPERLILQTPWLAVLLGGAMLGAFMLALILLGIAFFQALFGFGLSTFSLKRILTGTGSIFWLASLSSAAAVTVYVALYRSNVRWSG